LRRPGSELSSSTECAPGFPLLRCAEAAGDRRNRRDIDEHTCERLQGRPATAPARLNWLSGADLAAALLAAKVASALSGPSRWRCCGVGRFCARSTLIWGIRALPGVFISCLIAPSPPPTCHRRPCLGGAHAVCTAAAWLLLASVARLDLGLRRVSGCPRAGCPGGRHRGAYSRSPRRLADGSGARPCRRQRWHSRPAWAYGRRAYANHCMPRVVSRYSAGADRAGADRGRDAGRLRLVSERLADGSGGAASVRRLPCILAGCIRPARVRRRFSPATAVWFTARPGPVRGATGSKGWRLLS
jgi:hypothetical protein